MNSLRVISVMLALILAPSHASAQGLTDLQGKVEIDGSSTVAPITIEVANKFSSLCPRVNVPVAVSGTGGGFKRFTRGGTDISNASRPIRLSEVEQCRANDVRFVEIPIAYDGLTIVVNRDTSWVEELTVDELRMIFCHEQPARKWSDVRAEWPAKEIKIYAPGTDSGTFDYFKEVVARDGALRDDMSVSEDDNQLVTAVAKTRGAIGFFGAAYYFANVDKLKAVAIVNPQGKAILPTSDTIADGSYAPFSRPLFIYVNASAIRRPEVKLFVKFYLEHAAELATRVGYVGLPPELYEAAAKILNHRPRPLTGTHFLTAEGPVANASLPELYLSDQFFE